MTEEQAIHVARLLAEKFASLTTVINVFEDHDTEHDDEQQWFITVQAHPNDVDLVVIMEADY